MASGHDLGFGTRGARALRRRCPLCETPVFETYFRMRAVCPGCGLRTDRGEPDYFLGAMLLNLMVTEMGAAGLVVVGVLLTWPSPPWGLILWGGFALAVLLPVAFYPVAKALWLAVDLRFRSPVHEADDGTAPDA